MPAKKTPATEEPAPAVEEAGPADPGVTMTRGNAGNPLGTSGQSIRRRCLPVAGG